MRPPVIVIVAVVAGVAGATLAVLFILLTAIRPAQAQLQTCNYWPYGYHGSAGTLSCLYGGQLGPEGDSCPSCLKWPAP